MLKYLLPVALGALTVSATGFTDEAKAPADALNMLAGEWSWEHKTEIPGSQMFGGIEHESNKDCLTDTMKPFTVQALMDELTNDIPEQLGQKCKVHSVVPSSDGFDFKLTCTGPYAGEASGKATLYSEEKVAINATGTLSLFGGAASGPFKMDAKAERLGTCPAKKG